VAGHSLLLAVRVAAPVVVTLILTVLILALIGRIAPQFSVLASGLGVNSLVAWTALSLCLASVAWVFHDQTQVSLDRVWDAIGTLGQSSVARP
jgi:flagellar biosynthesis protein FliR